MAQHPPQRPVNPFAHLLNIAARAASAGVDAYAGQAPASTGGGREATCTPCEAMARRRKARRLVRGT